MGGTKASIGGPPPGEGVAGGREERRGGREEEGVERVEEGLDREVGD